MEFTEEQWLGLKRHADEKGLEFLSSPFSIEAAKMLQRIGVRAWKIASGEITNSPLFDFIIETRLPVMLSTGMSTIEETELRWRAFKAPEFPWPSRSARPCIRVLLKKSG